MTDDPNDLFSYDDFRPPEYRPVPLIPSREEIHEMFRLRKENDTLRTLLLNCFDLIEDLRPVGYRNRVREWKEQAKALGMEVQD